MTHDDHSPPPARVPPCPDEGRLAAWLAQPDADRPAHLHAHLHACPACRERAARLRDEDAFARRFAHALNPRAPSPSDG